VSRKQWESIQSHIAKGISDGAVLVCGGLGLPDGLSKGYHVRPTVFANVTTDMAIAQEEIFGPVLVIIGYASPEQAIDIANDTCYGLAAYIQAADHNKACEMAKALRVGSVFINNPPFDLSAPIGGFKQSGYGREWGEFGLDEFLTTRTLLGFVPPELRSA
jgi:aldehyde dehydrogenase (NAD+)